MDQGDASRFVLHQHQVHPLGLLALAVDRLVLVQHLGLEVGVLEPVLPCVDDQSGHRAVLRLEHPKGDAGRGVVLGLVGEGAVVGLEDVLQLRQGFVRRPELEPVPLDDAALLGVEDLGIDLLLAELRPLVLHDLLSEVVRQVVDVGVGRGGRQEDVIALPAHQLDDQVLGARGGGAYQAGLPVSVHLQAHAEHDLVPRLLQVLPSGQLISPATVKLWTPEALRLRRWDALDQGAVDQLELVHLLVVVSDQYLGDDGQEP